MELKQLLENYFNTHEQFLNDTDKHNTWTAFNCWIIREYYTFLPPKGTKTIKLLESLETLGIKYQLPKSDKPKSIILSDLLIDNFDNPNAIEMIISTLEDNCVVIKNTDLEEYIESLRVMGRLTGESEDKNLFTRIRYINKIHKYEIGVMSRIIYPILAKYDPDIRGSWTSSLNSDSHVHITKYFDASKIVSAKTKSKLVEEIKSIKQYEKEVGKNKTPLFVDKKISISMNYIFTSKDIISTLNNKGWLTDKSTVYHGDIKTDITRYRLCGMYDISSDYVDEKDNVCLMSYGVRFHITELYHFLIDNMKAK